MLWRFQTKILETKAPFPTNRRGKERKRRRKERKGRERKMKRE